MDKKEWSEFFGKGHSKRSYHLRRTCAKCNHPIVDVNRSGYCVVCSKNMQYSSNRTGVEGGESSEHKHLKVLACEFLTENGYSDVRTEVRMGKPPCMVKCDVVGSKNGAQAIIECGGSMRKKLIKASSLVEIIYVWPFGSARPYRWNEGMLVCNNCGHKT